MQSLAEQYPEVEIMPVFRKVCRQNYTVLDNELLNDQALDWRSLGLLCFLLSKSETWNVSITHLSNLRADGKHSIRKSLNNLIKTGYIKRRKIGNGKVEYDIYGERQETDESYPQAKVQKSDSGYPPKSENRTQRGTLSPKNPKCENPKSENRTLENKELLESKEKTRNARARESGDLVAAGEWLEKLKENIRALK